METNSVTVAQISQSDYLLEKIILISKHIKRGKPKITLLLM